MNDLSQDLLELQQSQGGVLTHTAEESTSYSATLRFCHPPVRHFGNPQAEYEAAGRTSALFDVSDRVQIEFEGRDARKLLHGFCTNDIQALAAGTGCEAFVTNVKGRVLAHVLVFVDEKSVWLDTGPTDEARLIAHFDRYIFHEDVRLCGRSGQLGELLLTGPAAASQLAALGVPADTLVPFAHLRHDRDLGPWHVRRADMLGSPGFLLSVARDQLTRAWQVLVSAGGVAAGAEAFHARRIERGFPLDGLDLGDHLLAPEADRNEQAISYKKGCYLGQEPIARIDALGHVNRLLRRIEAPAQIVLQPGDPLLDGDGATVGTITSSAIIPGQGRTVAWALVRASHTHSSQLLRLPNNESASILLDQ